MKRTLRLPLAAAVAAILVGVYYLVDPASAPWMPRCWFHWLTGLQCPGCGSQRMIHALLHGDLHGAWHHNALLLLLTPLILWMFWLETVRTRRPRLYARFYTRRTTFIIAGLLIAWGIARNLPHLR